MYYFSILYSFYPFISPGGPNLGKVLNLNKDRGGPAQLGIRDWAGLKGHIDDRNLACSLASEG